MPTYIISKLQISGSEREKEICSLFSSDYASHRYVRETEITSQPLQNRFGEGITMIISEPVEINFIFLPAPVKISLITKVNIFLRNRTPVMISSPRGIGLVARGRPTSYVRSYIGPVVSEYFSPLDIALKPYHLSNEEMNFLRWGEETSRIRVDIYDLGRVSIDGKALQEKFRKDNMRSLIETGEIDEFRVFSKDLGRVVSISRMGVIRTSLDDINKVSHYISERLMWGV